MNSRWTKILEWSLGFLGLALLILTIQAVGIEKIALEMKQFGWGPMLALTLLYTWAQIAFCGAWLSVVPGPTRPNSWLFWKAYLAGDALNMTVPSGNLAGEPVKILLLQNSIATPDAIASVTIYKIADFLSLTLFLFLGWLWHFSSFQFPPLWQWGGGLVVLGMLGFCGVLHVMQHRGIFAPVLHFLARQSWGAWLLEKLSHVHTADQNIQAFIREKPKSFWLAVFLNFLAWWGGVLEIFLFCRWINAPISLSQAWVIETFSMLLNNVAFFIPARLGILEGGRALLFAALGQGSALGLTYSLVRRVREFIWIGIGFVIFFFRKK